MNERQDSILISAREFAKSELENDSSGHDWWHTDRVTKLAIRLAETEGADLYICELAALLHDVADEKLNETKESGLSKVSLWLDNHTVQRDTVAHIMDIISGMSYSGGNNITMETLEGRVVQDADRLDALGAIGIARTFAYSGWKGQLIHDPNLSFREFKSLEEYRIEKSTAINHFYEKLLKLKDLMNTITGKQMAAERHAYMEDFLHQFFREWNAEYN